MAVAVTAALGASLAPIVADPRAPAKRVQVVAHRGGAGLAPENTLTAYRNAIRLGADYVEIDVRQTADSRLVIMHDSAVDRTTNGSGQVRTMTGKAIANLTAGKGSEQSKRRERVPTLDDVIRVCRGRIGLYIDHKEASVPKVLEALRRRRFGDRVVVYGSPNTLREYRDQNAGLMLMQGHPGSEAEMQRAVAALRPLALDGHLLEWNAEQVASAHRLGATVWMDVMGATDTEDGYEKAVAMGADALQTDYPDKLIRWLRERKLR